MKEDLLKIVNHYGINNQLRKFNEECFELEEAIITYQKLYDESCCSSISVSRFAEERKHIIEEIADVTVMLNQFKKYYCITDKDLVEVTKFKIARQLERIENETVAKNELRIKSSNLRRLAFDIKDSKKVEEMRKEQDDCYKKFLFYRNISRILSETDNNK